MSVCRQVPVVYHKSGRYHSLEGNEMEEMKSSALHVVFWKGDELKAEELKAPGVSWQ